MDTAYKTRAWWILRALGYAYGALTEAEYKGYNPEQLRIWNAQCDESAANAVAEAGSPCLTRVYVDRSGDLRPEYRAA